MRVLWNWHTNLGTVRESDVMITHGSLKINLKGQFPPPQKNEILSNAAVTLDQISILCLVVSVLAFYSDNPSSNPAKSTGFSVNCLKITKLSIKRPGIHLKIEA